MTLLLVLMEPFPNTWILKFYRFKSSQSASMLSVIGLFRSILMRCRPFCTKYSNRWQRMRTAYKFTLVGKQTAPPWINRRWKFDLHSVSYYSIPVGCPCMGRLSVMCFQNIISTKRLRCCCFQTNRSSEMIQRCEHLKFSLVIQQKCPENIHSTKS